MNPAFRVALLALAPLLASCESLRSHSRSLRLHIDDGKIQATSNTGQCAKLTYVGSDGMIGCEMHTLPAEDICPPPGTRSAFGELVDCPSDLRQHLHHPNDTPQDVQDTTSQGPDAQHLETYHFFGLPLDIQPGEVYLEYDLEIRAPTRVRARSIRDQILTEARRGLSGFQHAIPGAYTIRHLARAQLIGRDLFLTLFSTERFEQLNLDLNDVRAYRELPDALLVERNGWYMAGLSIGLTDLHWGIVPGVEYVNRYRIEWTTGRGPEVFEGEWGYRI